MFWSNFGFLRDTIFSINSLELLKMINWWFVWIWPGMLARRDPKMRRRAPENEIFQFLSGSSQIIFGMSRSQVNITKLDLKVIWSFKIDQQIVTNTKLQNLSRKWRVGVVHVQRLSDVSFFLFSCCFLNCLNMVRSTLLCFCHGIAKMQFGTWKQK